MKRFSLMVASLALVLGTAGTAVAGSCPAEMKKIDAALAASPKLTDAQMSEVKKLRADGEAQHKAGSHGDSMASLNKAKAILNVK
jgi:hypothetical protein